MKDTNVSAPMYREKKERRRADKGFAKSVFSFLTNGETETRSSTSGLILSVLLWVVLAAGAYWLATSYMQKNQAFLEQKITQVEEQNHKQIENMQAQLSKVETEMETVKAGMQSINEELQLTGQTIGGTNKTKEALQQRIDQLNKQLVELKGSLKKLEDAARAW